jgi:hypothetical protein
MRELRAMLEAVRGLGYRKWHAQVRPVLADWLLDHDDEDRATWLRDLPGLVPIIRLAPRPGSKVFTVNVWWRLGALGGARTALLCGHHYGDLRELGAVRWPRRNLSRWATLIPDVVRLPERGAPWRTDGWLWFGVEPVRWSMSVRLDWLNEHNLPCEAALEISREQVELQRLDMLQEAFPEVSIVQGALEVAHA